MARPRVQPVDREVCFAEHEIIVSKTDPLGKITYANDVFLRVAGFTEQELLGQPHNCIRHPDMPRCVFKLLWDTLQSGEEIFAYVKNMAKDGSYYWVFAHVTPSFDPKGGIVGYHSNRRVPERAALDAVIPLYQSLLRTERTAATAKEGMEAAHAQLVATLEDAGLSYGEFVFSLGAQEAKV